MRPVAEPGLAGCQGPEVLEPGAEQKPRQDVRRRTGRSWFRAHWLRHSGCTLSAAVAWLPRTRFPPLALPRLPLVPERSGLLRLAGVGAAQEARRSPCHTTRRSGYGGGSGCRNSRRSSGRGRLWEDQRTDPGPEGVNVWPRRRPDQADWAPRRGVRGRGPLHAAEWARRPAVLHRPTGCHSLGRTSGRRGCRPRSDHTESHPEGEPCRNHRVKRTFFAGPRL